MDAGNMLKPALARGELHTIGATRLDEYRQNIEKDPALERRFQPVIVREPTVGFDPEFGARPLRRAIQRELENELSRLVLDGSLAPDDRGRVGFRHGELTFDVEKGGAEPAEDLDAALEARRRPGRRTGRGSLAAPPAPSPSPSGTKGSPTRWRFRPPTSLTFRLGLAASPYSPRDWLRSSGAP
jgi:hypothetical protein